MKNNIILQGHSLFFSKLNDVQALLIVPRLDEHHELNTNGFAIPIQSQLNQFNEACVQSSISLTQGWNLLVMECCVCSTSQTTPYSLYSAVSLTRDPWALVKGSELAI